MITGNPQATIADGAAWLLALMRDISIPSLGALCPELAALVAAAEGGDAGAAEALQGIVTATMNASSTKGNPVVLSREQLKEVLLQAMKCGAQH
jgi:alcohol dehydrogenase class IV